MQKTINYDQRLRRILQIQKKSESVDSDDLDYLTSFIKQFPQLVEYTKEQPEYSHVYLRDIAKYMQYKELKCGEVLEQEGEKFSAFYLVLLGKLECFTRKPPQQISKELNDLNNIKTIAESEEGHNQNLSLLASNPKFFIADKQICLFQHSNVLIYPYNCLGEVLKDNGICPYLVVANQQTEIAYISQEVCFKMFATQKSQLLFLESTLCNILSPKCNKVK